MNEQLGTPVPEGTEVTITQPDDFHLHLRKDKQMEDIVGHSARWARRAIIMPNTSPPITDTIAAWCYYEDIRDAVKYRGMGHFKPLMTLYLTDNTPLEAIGMAKKSGIVKAVKLYPAGATTNSDSGVTDIKKIYPVFEEMQNVGMVLSAHGEVTDPSVDIFHREGMFVDRVLRSIIRNFPDLKIVLEHLSTAYAVGFVAKRGENIAATIAPQYLLANRDDMLGNGIRPDLYCNPVLKTAADQQVLLKAATSGNPKFFLGTDSAPHPRRTKYGARGKGGCFTAHAALELYAEAFESMNALDKLEGFASHFGADFYGLPRNTSTITLVKEPWRVPESYPFGNDVVVPFRAGQMVQWKMKKE